MKRGKKLKHTEVTVRNKAEGRMESQLMRVRKIKNDVTKTYWEFPREKAHY